MNQTLEPYVSQEPLFNVTLPQARQLVTALRKLRNYVVNGIFANPAGVDGANAITEEQLLQMGALESDKLYLLVQTDDMVLRSAWQLIAWLALADPVFGITEVMADRFGPGAAENMATTAVVTMPEVQVALKAALAIITK